MKILKLIPLFFLATGPVFAQTVHFGAQVGISSPLGDLKDGVNKKLGYTVGISMGLEHEDGHVFRPRLDYTQHKGKYVFSSDLDSKATSFFLGVDYNYFLSEKAGNGFFLLAGLGIAETKFEIFDPALLSYASSRSKNTIAYAVGFGFQFTPLLGAEVRYFSTHPNFDNAGKTFENETVNASITFRF